MERLPYTCFKCDMLFSEYNERILPRFQSSGRITKMWIGEKKSLSILIIALKLHMKCDSCMCAKYYIDHLFN